MNCLADWGGGGGVVRVSGGGGGGGIDNIGWYFTPGKLSAKKIPHTYY